MMDKSARGSRPAPAITALTPHRSEAASTSGSSRTAAAALVLAGMLVLFGNGLSALPESFYEHWGVSLGKVSLLLPLLLWAVRVERLSAQELGFARGSLVRSALLGGVLAVLLSVPIILYFAFPLVVAEGQIEYEGVADETVGSLLLWALIQQPLGTAVFEEVSFRGVLQALAIRPFGAVRGVTLTAATFTLWHAVINYRTLQQTNVGDDPLLAGLAHAGSFAGLFAGGLLLSILRQRTGSLAGPIVFHWLIVVAMMSGLFVLAG